MILDKKMLWPTFKTQSSKFVHSLMIIGFWYWMDGRTDNAGCWVAIATENAMASYLNSKFQICTQSNEYWHSILTLGKLSKIIWKKHMEFSKCRGGSGRVIFYMFSTTHQNASKAFFSHFRHFYCVLFYLWPNIWKNPYVFFR